MQLMRVEGLDLRVECTDEDVLAALVRAHRPALLAYATRLTGVRQDAEDIVQETFTRVWTHLDTVAALGDGTRPWLFTVARHLVVDLARARSSRPRAVLEAPPQDVVERAALDGDHV